VKRIFRLRSGVLRADTKAESNDPPKAGYWHELVGVPRRHPVEL